MIHFPNATGEVGTFFTDTANYVEINDPATTLTDPPTLMGFAARAAADSWNTGDLVGVKVAYDETNFQVWTGEWDAANQRIVVVTLEESLGTINNAVSVNIFACPTKGTLRAALAQLGEQTTVVISGTSYTATSEDAGKLLVFTGSSAATLTIDADVPLGYHVLVVREGVGSVTVDCESGDTINNLSPGTGVNVSARWKSAYIYKRTANALVCIA